MEVLDISASIGSHLKASTRGATEDLPSLAPRGIWNSGGRDGGNHLFLVDHKDTRYIDCREVELPYGPALVQDILNRTETAMTQEHCFLATELALRAEKNAVRIG